MKQFNKYLAMALALVMLLSNAHLGLAFSASAAEIGTGEKSITTGELLQLNYQISDDEVRLVDKYLVSDTYKYDVPTDALITIDSENKTVQVGTIGNWTVEKVELVSNNVTTELTQNEGVYPYNCDATFYISVQYKLTQTVDNQEQLLTAAGNLVTAADGLKNAYDSVENVTKPGTDEKVDVLGAVVSAMPVLNRLAEGIQMDLGMFGSVTEKFGDAAVNAVATLNEGMANGKLALKNENDVVANYMDGSTASVLEYLAANAAKYQKLYRQTYECFETISKDNLLIDGNNVDRYLEKLEPENYSKWTAFKTGLRIIVGIMKPHATAAAWNVSAMKAGLSADDYVALEALARSITPTTVETYVNPLLVAEQPVQKTQNMYKVAVNVVIKSANGQIGSTDLIVAGTKNGEVILPAGTSISDVKDAANAVAAQLLDGWAIYDAEHSLLANQTDLTGDSLSEDVTITYTYEPKNYTVSFDYGDPMTVPYGYKYRLPVCEEAGKDYDYTVNGGPMTQGSVIPITGDTTIKREAGKAYTHSDFYSVVAEYFCKDAAADILNSGALTGNTTFSYRLPNAPTLTLEGRTLTIEPATYPSSYNGNWQAYYGETGSEKEYTKPVEWTGKQANVQYKLMLRQRQEDVERILDLVNTLKSEADGQINVLENLYGMYDELDMLGDRVIIIALKTMMEETDFYPGESEKTDAMQGYFKTHLDLINLDCKNLIVAMGSKDTSNKLYQYYTNSQLRTYVADLSAHLSAMLETQEHEDALATFFDQKIKGSKYDQYYHLKDKIPDLKRKIAEIQKDLVAPNTAIDLSSANLLDLTNALQSGTVETKTAAAPYILTDPYTVTDATQVTVRVNIEIDGVNTVISLPDQYVITAGGTLSAQAVTWLKNEVNTYLTQNVIGYSPNDAINEAKKYYDVTSDLDLDSLRYATLDETKTFNESYSLKNFNVTLNGENKWSITAKKLSIVLDKHPDSPAWEYKYVVNGNPASGTYTFTLEDIKNGNLSVTRTEEKLSDIKLEDAFANSNIISISKGENGEYASLHADVNPDKAGLAAFGQAMILSRFNYIGLNGEPLFYLNEEGNLELCVQTLVNAILADDNFSSDLLIALGQNNTTTFALRSTPNNLLTASMQLGNSATDLYFNDLTFTMALTSTPDKMTTLANALEAVRNYLTFHTENGELVVELNLPEKVYEAYLTARLGAGYNTNDNLNEALNAEIAYAYLCDVIDLMANSNVDVDTIKNTMNWIDGKVNIPDSAENQVNDLLDKIDPYLEKLKNAIKNDSIEIVNGNDHVAVSVTAKGTAINSLLENFGFDLHTMTGGAIKIKELDTEGGYVETNAKVQLVNVPNGFEAIVIDVNAIKEGYQNLKNGINDLRDGASRNELIALAKGYGLANGFDYTDNLAARIPAGASAIMLLKDITGNLTFTGTTILDLNGKTINGSITANGHLYIIDSSMATADSGTVTGSVSGNVSIVAGHYPNADVTAFLSDGYKVVNGNVQNALYTIEANGDAFNFIINTDVMTDGSVTGYLPSVRALATDIVSDVVLNSYLFASLTADNNVIYSVGIENLVDLLTSDTAKADLINAVLYFVRTETSSNFINAVIADLVDFGAIQTAILNEQPVATYTLATSPWTVKFETTGEGANSVIDFGIVPNENVVHNHTLSVTLVGENRTKLADMFGKLKDNVIASGEIHVNQPTYGNRTLYLSGTGSASLDIDLSKNTDWQTLVAVIMAYGNPSKANDLVNAIGNPMALKAVFNSMTVAEVFNALKAMNRNTSFTQMADSLGVTLNVPGASQMEELFNLALCGVGGVLDRLDITGYTDKTMGMLEIGNSGRYKLTANTSRSADITRRGFTLDVQGVVDTVKLAISLFGDNKFDISYANMTLANSLEMNFAFAKNHVADWTGHYAQIVKTYADGRSDVVEDVPFVGWEDNGAYYVVSFSDIAAKEMTDEIRVTIYNAEGEAVSHVWVDSVEAYAKRVMDLYSTNDKLITMIVDMLNYGAYSQTFFNYNTNDLANADLTAEQLSHATSSSPQISDSLVCNDMYYGSSLILESRILLKMAFKNGVEGMTAQVSFTDHYGNEVVANADLILDNGFAVVDIDEIVVADARQPVTVTVYNPNGTVYSDAQDSVESYIARIMAVNNAPLFEQIMKFADSAHDFLHSNN